MNNAKAKPNVEDLHFRFDLLWGACCAPKSMPRKEVARLANLAPAGIGFSKPWKVARGKSKRCLDDPKRIHHVLEC
jgi:hypothetical protein